MFFNGLVIERPAGAGELAVRLALSGVTVEPAEGCARLVLDNSRRKIAYSRLRVTDATGKELMEREHLERAGVGDNRVGVGAGGIGQRRVRGGNFTTAGGIAANGIARWDGSAWSALGSGIQGQVNALAVSGSDLFAGGAFATAGGSPATNIAKWDGSSWSALGSGIEGGVSALAVSGNDLYAGGQFSIAGGKVSEYMARAYLLDFPALSIRRSGTDVQISWPSADTADFALEQAGALSARGSWVASSADIADDGTTKSVSLPATSNAQLFRLRRP